MKKYFYNFINAIIFVSTLTIFVTEAKENPCLTLFWRTDSTFRNPDSVYVDTCNWTGVRQEFPTDRMWGKKFFYIKCNFNIIPRNYLAPADSIIEYSWDNILEKYTQARSEFQNLQNIYGNLHFRDYHPETNDTTIVKPRQLFLIFENYVKITEIDSILNTFTCVKRAWFVSWPSILSSVPEENKIIFNIFPNPATQKATIKFELDQPAYVSLKLTDMLGNQISLIENKFIDSGSHSYDWDASGYPAGVYYYVLEAGGSVRAGKVVVVR